MTGEETPIHVLMDRDPLELTDGDIDAIVADLRSRRKAYNSGAAQAGNTKKPTAAQKKKAEAAKAALGNTSLSDLGL